VDLYILTSIKDRAASAITSASNVTPLSGPTDLPELVVGTTEPMTVRHLSAASTYETWSYAADHTVSVALGIITSAGIKVYASGTLSTVITDQGKSGSLALTSSTLVNALTEILGTRTTGRTTMVLQVTVTDASANKRVFAQLPVTVRGTVPTFTQT
jgi:hypothetical protein